jgi:hypothetical protein
MKSSSRLEIINGEISWKAVCNRNQTVKAMDNTIVNGNA